MKPFKKYRGKLSSKEVLRFATPLFIVIVVVSVGLHFLLGTHASSPYASTYAADGTLSGQANLIGGGTNSNAQAVQFGSSSSGGTPITFSKGTNWQTMELSSLTGGGQLNLSNSNVIAGLTQDATDMQNAGIKWIRLSVPLSTTDSQYMSLSSIETFSNIMLAKGVTPEILLFPGTDDDSTTMSNMESWLTTAVPQLAAVGIHYWEIGNEDNIYSNWDSCSNVTSSSTATSAIISQTVSSYITLLAGAYNTIHQYDTNAFVTSQGLSWNPSYTGYCEITSSDWIAEFIKSQYQAWKYMDCFGIHPYDTSPDGVSSDVQSTRSMLDASSEFTNKPLCITEVGFWANGFTVGSQNGYIGSGDENLRAQDYTTMMNDLKADGITTPVFWYILYDQGINFPGYGLEEISSTTGRSYLPIYTAVKDYTP